MAAVWALFHGALSKVAPAKVCRMTNGRMKNHKIIWALS
jgi:hypothetical protein